MSVKRNNTEKLENKPKRVLANEISENDNNEEKNIDKHCWLAYSKCVEIMKTGVRVKDDCGECTENMFVKREQELEQIGEYLKDFQPKFKMAADKAREISLLKATLQQQSKDFETYARFNKEKLKVIEALIEEFFGKVMIHKEAHDDTVSMLVYAEGFMKQLKDGKEQNDAKNNEIRKKYEETDEKLQEKAANRLEFLRQLKEENTEMDGGLQTLISFRERHLALIEDLNVRKDYLQREMNEEKDIEKSLEESTDTMQAHLDTAVDKNHKLTAELEEVKCQMEQVDGENEKLKTALILRKTDFIEIEERIAKYKAENDVATDEIHQNKERAQFLQSKIDSLHKELMSTNEMVLNHSTACRDLEVKINRLRKNNEEIIPKLSGQVDKLQDLLAKREKTPDLNSSLDTSFSQFKPPKESTTNKADAAKANAVKKGSKPKSQLPPKIKPTIPPKISGKKDKKPDDDGPSAGSSKSIMKRSVRY